MTPSPSFRSPGAQHLRARLPDIGLHYVEIAADAKPLILLHGIGMDWRVWQALSRRLAPYFHLYMLDMRGHGASDKPPHGYTLAHYAADIEDLLDQLHLTDTVIVGSSLGAMVAAAIEAPIDVVPYRVLVDPPMTGGPIRDSTMLTDILHLKHEGVVSLTDYLASYNPGAGRFQLRSMAEMWNEAADGVIEDLLARPSDYFAIDTALRHNESKTLIVQADPTKGGVLLDAWAERALALLPRGSLQKFPGAGHAVHAHAPREFVKALFAFTDTSDIQQGVAGDRRLRLVRAQRGSYNRSTRAAVEP